MLNMYSSYPIETEDLVYALLRSFEREIPDYHDGQSSNRPWTRVVKATLRQLGEERNLDVYSADGMPDLCEFLVDVMWWNEGDVRPDAVFESEWGTVKEVALGAHKWLLIKAR